MIRSAMHTGVASSASGHSWRSISLSEAVVNRGKCATCVRNLPTIDCSVYKPYLLEYLVPVIKDKWTRKDRCLLIWIQQDNAKLHASPFDLEILTAGSKGGWNIQLTFQPSNSPDMNILDLGLFASLQSLQYRKHMRNIKDIIWAVC